MKAIFVFVATGMLGLSAADKPPADPVIDAARKAAATYEESLPDYIVRRTTERFRGARTTPSDPPEAVRFWSSFDTISADVTSEHGREVYSNIVRNGKSMPELPVGGAWSSGEFASELQTVLPPERAASFTHKRGEKISGRAVWHYEFAVDARHSTWQMSADHLPGEYAPQTLTPAFGGEIWIDSETGQVLKIRMAARDLPDWFALRAIQSDTEYGLVQIGQKDYVLPIHSVSVTCTRGAVCLKNETTFRNYDKFTANANITFDGAGK